MWDEMVEARLLSFSKYHIDMEIKIKEMVECFRLTGFYGDPVLHNRQAGWDTLKALLHRSFLPWVCAGDCNKILYNHEKWGGAPRGEHQMARFQETLETCGLEDLSYQGPDYTWTGNRTGGAKVRCRLDRAVANHQWQKLFPRSKVLVHNDPLSDPCAIILHCLTKQSTERGRRPF